MPSAVEEWARLEAEERQHRAAREAEEQNPSETPTPPSPSESVPSCALCSSSSTRSISTQIGSKPPVGDLQVVRDQFEAERLAEHCSEQEGSQAELDRYLEEKDNWLLFSSLQRGQRHLHDEQAERQWSTYTYLVFWAECIGAKKRRVAP